MPYEASAARIAHLLEAYTNGNTVLATLGAILLVSCLVGIIVSSLVTCCILSIQSWTKDALPSAKQVKGEEKTTAKPQVKQKPSEDEVSFLARISRRCYCCCCCRKKKSLSSSSSSSHHLEKKYMTVYLLIDQMEHIKQQQSSRSSSSASDTTTNTNPALASPVIEPNVTTTSTAQKNLNPSSPTRNVFLRVQLPSPCTSRSLVVQLLLAKLAGADVLSPEKLTRMRSGRCILSLDTTPHNGEKIREGGGVTCIQISDDDDCLAIREGAVLTLSSKDE